MLLTLELLYGLARNVLLPPLHFGIRWTIDGAQRIPVRGPVILASNHVSYLDPLVLAYLADRRHRKLRFLAKAELFDKRGLGPALRGIHQIPVQRGTSSASGSLTHAEEALGRGECVAVFPEGTRILFKGRKPKWRWGIAETVVVGDPVRIGSDENVYVATDRIMGAICACVARARELYPQRPRAGDDGWWVRPPGTARVRSARSGAA